MTKKPRGIAALAALALMPAAALANPIMDGVFTAAQAERGQEAYFAECAVCHGYELMRMDDEASDLTGFTFGINWVGQTLGQRFERVQTTMPLYNAGSLEDDTVLDIIAFILSFNDYPAGEAELTMEADLDAIEIPPAP